MLRQALRVLGVNQRLGCRSRSSERQKRVFRLLNRHLRAAPAEKRPPQRNLGRLRDNLWMRLPIGLLFGFGLRICSSGIEDRFRPAPRPQLPVTARALVGMFQKNFAKFEAQVDADVRAAAPDLKLAAE